jgi:hypothetical protein
VPGNYVAKLTVKGSSYTQLFSVIDDHRIDINISDRKAWTAKLMQIGEFYNDLTGELSKMAALQAHLAKLDRSKTNYDKVAGDEIKDVIGLYGELMSRTRGLYYGAQGWMGLLTQDQELQFIYYKEMLVKLKPKQAKMMSVLVKKLNKSVKKEDRYTAQ